jgi:hypothetical protein
MSGRSLLGRLPSAYARRMARWFGRRPFTLRNKFPIVSFTFDDFPRSALLTAGDFLEQSGARGTYFVSYGLKGQVTPTGEAFCNEDLMRLRACGHELGCHTFHHYPAWDTSAANYATSVVLNAASLVTRLETHSYPINYPRPGTKRRIEQCFRACRGGGQTFNRGTVDLNYLRSFFLEQSRDDVAAIEHVIEATAEACGWLIFSTHDVCQNPTRFGCTPVFFEKVVRISLRSGARILLMSAALDAVEAPPMPGPHPCRKPDAGDQICR